MSETCLPISVYLGLSYACNMRCSHCYADGENRQQHLPLAEVEKLLERLEAMFVCNIIFGHGEPFLYPDFMTVLKIVNSLRMNAVVMTNGWLVDEITASRLAEPEIRPYRINVSLDSADPGKHDANRKVPGSHARACQAIRLLKRQGHNIFVAAALSMNNPDQGMELLQLCRSLGVDGLSLLTIRDHTKPSRQITENYFDAIRSLMEEASLPPYVELLMHDPLLLAVESLGRPSSRFVAENRCTAATERIAISPDGSVTPCNLMKGPIAGNILHTDIGEIWEHSPALISMRQIRMGNGAVVKGCAQCAHYPDCNGGCLAFGKADGHTLERDVRCFSRSLIQ
ncbi:MAG: radical SAM protein [Candidatus Thiodiazotropha sp. (ex Dulcina madagascariensis)]|nr:radical SAM protein [Candidatus Thiodiazotropha sp. (ex Dulcina madagascariensis)]